MTCSMSTPQSLYKQDSNPAPSPTLPPPSPLLLSQAKIRLFLELGAVYKWNNLIVYKDTTITLIKIEINCPQYSKRTTLIIV